MKVLNDFLSIALSFSRGSSQPRDQTQVSCIVGGFFTAWATKEPNGGSVQFSHSVVSNSLQPHGPQHTRPPCPSPTPRVYSNSSPLSRWWHSTISPSCLQSVPSSVSSSESVLCIRQPKYWSFSFSISPSNEHSGLISFRIVWLGLLSVQGTLKSLLQHHSSKASILRCSAFFIVQLSHPYITTGKTIAVTSQTFVGRIMEDSWKINSVSKKCRTTVCGHECGCGEGKYVGVYFIK